MLGNFLYEKLNIFLCDEMSSIFFYELKNYLVFYLWIHNFCLVNHNFDSDYVIFLFKLKKIWILGSGKFIKALNSSEFAV